MATAYQLIFVSDDTFNCVTYDSDNFIDDFSGGTSEVLYKSQFEGLVEGSIIFTQLKNSALNW